MRTATRMVVLGKKEKGFTSVGFFHVIDVTRSASYEVAYSNDNINYTTSFSGIASASTCGIVNNSEKGFPVVARYWRYRVTGSTRHHPRCSRIFLYDSDGTMTNIKVYAQDNCNDAGGIPGLLDPATIIYDAVNGITISG